MVVIRTKRIMVMGLQTRRGHGIEEGRKGNGDGGKTKQGRCWHE